MVETGELQENIYKILKQRTEGISEYDLIQELKKRELFSDSKQDVNLGLFQHHFIVMHYLYHLNDYLWQKERMSLSISPLKITLTKASDNPSASVSIESNAKLRDYYLNWDNFETTGKGEVDDLLNNFWRDYARYIQQDDAWEILELPVDSDKSAIAKRYRELAAIHHPDKGGDQETFIKIRAAYESLRITAK